jgi:hypothetical protein
MGWFIAEETRLMLEMKGIVMLIDMKMLNQKNYKIQYKILGQNGSIIPTDVSKKRINTSIGHWNPIPRPS